MFCSTNIFTTGMSSNQCLIQDVIRFYLWLILYCLLVIMGWNNLINDSCCFCTATTNDLAISESGNMVLNKCGGMVTWHERKIMLSVKRLYLASASVTLFHSSGLKKDAIDCEEDSAPAACFCFFPLTWDIGGDIILPSPHFVQPLPQSISDKISSYWWLPMCSVWTE